MYDRMIDPLAIVRMSDEAYYGGAREAMSRMLRRAVCLSIDNVADYYWEQLAKADFIADRWRIDRAYPNLAPPFGEFWMEFRTPLAAREMFSRSTHIGALVNAVEPYVLDGHLHEFPDVDWEKTKWLLQFLTFNLLPDGIIVGPHVSITIPVDAYGAYVGICGQEGSPTIRCGLFNLGDDASGEAQAVAIAILNPCLLAISFMHCKNVVRILNESKLSRAERRRGEKPGVKYYTLEIEPMKEVLRHEGNIEHNGLQRALHICRGHFATYDESAPLFGKYAGTFWKPMHVRGSAKQGVIVKDYDIGAPN